MSTDSIRDWWADHPMTYGETHGETAYAEGAYEPGTRPFFERVDREFLTWNRPLHGERPFGRIFPFETYTPGGSVLELGCGMGTMAGVWSSAGADMTATDLNPVAIEQTARRFEVMNLPGRAVQADARALPFESGSFDYAYSWGVLHHSPDLASSLGEMMRVLRPGGGFGVMLYHRHSLLHAYLTLYVEGFLHLERRFLDPLTLASRYGDAGREEGNPYTWPVTRREVRDLLAPHADDVTVDVLGTDLDYVLALLAPGVGERLPRWIKKPWARRFGWSLWIHGHRR